MVEEDKIFNLLEKVYIELQETKAELKAEIAETKAELKADVKSVRDELADTKKEVTKIGLIIENEIRPNIKLLFEVQTDIMSKLEEHDKRFDNIERILHKHDIEICVIKGGKKSTK